MKHINILVGIIEKELQVEREIIKKSIRINNSKEYGDYTILCFMFKNHFKESPLIIAKKISSILAENGIKGSEAVGPYVNLYIEKERMLEKIFSQFNVEDKNIQIDEKILIINKIKSSSTVIQLNDLYKLIINEFIEGLYRNKGYKVECYNSICEKEKILSITNAYTGGLYLSTSLMLLLPQVLSPYNKYSLSKMLIYISILIEIIFLLYFHSLDLVLLYS